MDAASEVDARGVWLRDAPHGQGIVLRASATITPAPPATIEEATEEAPFNREGSGLYCDWVARYSCYLSRFVLSSSDIQIATQAGANANSYHNVKVRVERELHPRKRLDKEVHLIE